MLDPMGQWSVGLRWDVRAVYRQVHGGWSSPRLWGFTVAGDNPPAVTVEGTDSGGSGAQLFFDRQAGRLRQIALSDTVRGQTVLREVRIETPAPVYPAFSAIPFYFPYLAYRLTVDDYPLKRLLNGRSTGVEVLSQSVEPVDKETMLSDIPEDDARKALEAMPITGSGLLFTVEKRGAFIFKQYWFPGLPWAVYTESKDCRAWLSGGES